MTSEYRIPAPLQNTIDNLSFLASTQEGDKLFFKEKSHVKECEWMARARRYYYNENYETQKKIIQEIIDLGLDSLKTYEGHVHFHRLVKEFHRAKDGLYKLRNTYLKLGTEIANLDTQIYIMEQRIKDIPQEDMIKAGIISGKNKQS
jgi:hypothetical protein